MSVSKFQKLVNKSFLFRLFLIKSLPMAFIAGVKVKELNNSKAITTIKYGWLNQNPFKSMYFACQAMAAEMSTGLLVLNHTYQANPSVSMLVKKMSVEYFKKVVGKSYFTCEDGNKVIEAIETSKRTGEGVLLEMKSVGRDDVNDIVSEFIITWSIKVKQ